MGNRKNEEEQKVEKNNKSELVFRMDGTDIVTFRENDKAFRLFGTNVHVKVGLVEFHKNDTISRPFLFKNPVEQNFFVDRTFTERLPPACVST